MNKSLCLVYLAIAVSNCVSIAIVPVLQCMCPVCPADTPKDSCPNKLYKFVPANQTTCNPCCNQCVPITIESIPFNNTIPIRDTTIIKCLRCYLLDCPLVTKLTCRAPNRILLADRVNTCRCCDICDILTTIDPVIRPIDVSVAV